ncbi:hypothetical protein ACWC24_17260 [Streptomyces sp. NPDC001443]
MANYPDFGALLTRLLEHRGVDFAWLADASGIPETELRSVVSGTPPPAAQLDDLASALGFHAIDLHVIAAIPRPESFAPRDPAVGSAIADLIHITMALPADQRTRIQRIVDQLPQEREERPSGSPYMYDQQEAGFGAMLANLLCGNRNLRSLTGAAKTVALLTEGRVYLAASTISGIGRGRVPLTPDLVAGFESVLGIPPGDLAAIVGVALPEPSRPDDPRAAEMARLLWSCRSLNASQVQCMRDEAESMLIVVPDDASDEDWISVHHHHEKWWGAPRR